MIAQRRTRFAIEKDYETIAVFDSYQEAQDALDICHLGDGAAVIVEDNGWNEEDND